ncbi:GSU2403 family nucleotidyltransferase fold protein [Polynucleobacter asymbioticus]|uniref:nucleotidyltransferase family protein n=1 Tax=Polynucleobacter asymbioticus TaxID=576611 RepID=UPI0008F927AF|nr:nucleotidyltransferase domain-containing protein [Polynucleobacter asymbioticus]
MTNSFYKPLSLTAQTAYAELQDQLRIHNIDRLRVLPGAFHKQTQKGKSYIYYGYRDLDGSGRMAYVGPEDQRVNELIQKHQALKGDELSQKIKGLAKSAEALGCASTLTKHFRVVNRLDQYGFFRAGGILIGTHAFLAMGNMLGVKWLSSNLTMDVDFAHAGKNVSIALGANVKISVHDALNSLEMGLLPIAEFSGKTGAQYRNPKDPELRLDFVTPQTRDGGPVILPNLGLTLECLKFMEYSLVGTTQTVLLSKEGACMVNIPAPERYAVHKLIIYGERPLNEHAKANKDLGQAAAIFKALFDMGNGDLVRSAWSDALSRGPGWVKRLNQGRAALLKRYPELLALANE